MKVRPAKRLSLAELAPHLLELNDPPRLLVWQELFGNENPVEIEVGFGKGLFLQNQAEARPTTNFLGVEIVRKYQLFAATRLAKRNLSNVRLVKADARLFLRHSIPSNSVQAIHVYFPDPWWKRRHEKRRVFTEEFVSECIRALKPGGFLRTATDVEDYSQRMIQLTDSRPELRRSLSPSEKPATHDMDYLTNFERKFRKEGKPIYRAEWEKRGMP